MIKRVSTKLFIVRC